MMTICSSLGVLVDALQQANCSESGKNVAARQGCVDFAAHTLTCMFHTCNGTALLLTCVIFLRSGRNGSQLHGVSVCSCENSWQHAPLVHGALWHTIVAFIHYGGRLELGFHLG